MINSCAFLVNHHMGWNYMKNTHGTSDSSYIKMASVQNCIFLYSLLQMFHKLSRLHLNSTSASPLFHQKLQKKLKTKVSLTACWPGKAQLDKLGQRTFVNLEHTAGHIIWALINANWSYLPAFDESWNVKGDFKLGAKLCRLADYLLTR